MSRIDTHVHVISPDYLVEADKRGGIGWPGKVPGLPELAGAMDGYGIAASVLSLPVPLGFGGELDSAAQRALARSCNEHYADLVRAQPDRLAALAVLPLPDVDAALEELTYALDELKLDGAVLLTQYDGVYLGNAAYDELFDELERRRAYVFVHPAHAGDPLEMFFGSWLLELPFATTRAVMSLMFTGTLARCPNVRMQFAHMGGVAPYLMPRVLEAFARFPQAAEVAPEGLEHLRRLYWDTGLSVGPAPIRAALELTSPDRIVFGTDWPFDLARPEDSDDPAPGLAFLGDQRPLVDRQNALALVPRLA